MNDEGSPMILRRLLAISGAIVLLSAACGTAATDTVSTGQITTKSPSVSLVGRAPVPYVMDMDMEMEMDIIEVHVSMVDFQYGPSDIEVPLGATVRFMFDNAGTVEHEAIVADLDTHLAQVPSAEPLDKADNHDDDMNHDHEADMDHDENTDHDHEADMDHDEDMDAAPASDDIHANHGDVPLLVLGTGESGDLVVTFDTLGEFVIGCHIPGHWEAGMRATIRVVEAA
jgi:uncharacterized cupredoxin-like copper-binding protein